MDDAAEPDVNTVLRHLDEVEQRADFWCRLVSDTGPSRVCDYVDQVAEKLRTDSEKVDLSDLRENMLEKLFDLSPERLKEVYESIDRDSDGRIIVAEFREGLARYDLYGLDGALEKVLQEVSTFQTGSLQLCEFASVLTRLKLAQLLSTTSRPTTLDNLVVIDYNEHAVRVMDGNVRNFFFGHRSPDSPMRWVHMRGCQLNLLLALSIKYQLHPLTVEDVIDQSPTKIERYGAHYFAAMELIYATGGTHGQEPVKARGRHVSLFCAGPPHLDTVITIAQTDRSFARDWPGGVPPDAGAWDDPWVEKLQKRLKALRSRVRERRADFLMYEIIDLCTDQQVLVTRAYAARLNWLESTLYQGLFSSQQEKSDWFNEVVLIRLQLDVATRRLRGLQRILRRLHDDGDLCRALATYLGDVADHVNEASEDAGHLAEKCTTLKTAYEYAEERDHERTHQLQTQRQTMREEKMNRMLFILTVLTTIFTPLTFLAGVYGMNFQDDGGRPTIPELLLPHGYESFWLLSIVYLALSGVGALWLWRHVNRPSSAPRLGHGLGRTEVARPPAAGDAYVPLPNSPRGS